MYRLSRENLKTRPYLLQALQVGADIVEKQCVAEIKRNTFNVVFSEGFLELTEDMIMELTSWNDLTIAEVNLYKGMKK